MNKTTLTENFPFVKRETIPYTPDISLLFSRFADADKAILLDSGNPSRQQGRYDIFSAWPTKYTQIKNNLITRSINEQAPETLANLEELITFLNQHPEEPDNDLPFAGGWIGFASYELTYLLEKTVSRTEHNLSLPVFSAAYYPWAIIQDHQQQQAWLVYEEDIAPQLLDRVHHRLQAPKPTRHFKLHENFRQTIDFSTYQSLIDKIHHYLEAGDCYQVNLAMQYTSHYEGSPFSAYQRLRQAVPSPYMAYINLDQQQILSISPECFLSAQDKHIHSRPIKGTSARHPDPVNDNHAAQLLASSEKNRAENLMIVDLLRNDLGRFCTTGSIKVEDLFTIESYENVHHLVSSIHGTLKKDNTTWDAFFGCFPGGSITGAPKIRACQIIAELESSAREIYCGSVFYASNNGRFDSSITIRTLLCDQGNILAWAGGGIVKDSTAKDEYQECHNKINHLLKALENERPE